MNLFRWMGGTVRLELTSANLPDTLSKINDRGVMLFDSDYVDELTVFFSVPSIKLRQVQDIAKKSGAGLKICAEKGFGQVLCAVQKRIVLALGLVAVIALSVWCASHIIIIEVEGNEAVSTNRILQEAAKAGVYFGASKKAVRSESMKNQLLKNLPELQWAGIQTEGSRAIIRIQERTGKELQLPLEKVSHIVSARDGILTSCVVTNGVSHCAQGQAVKEGQMLVSGYVDYGGVIKAVRAEAEIFAQTLRNIDAVFPLTFQKRGHDYDVERKFSLQIGKKRINFFKGSGICDTSCVKMVSKYNLTLPGGYQLPVSVMVEEFYSYGTKIARMDKAVAEPILCDHVEELLERTGLSLRVIQSQIQTFPDDDILELSGLYYCEEMIGREQWVQIGELHGKTE